MTLENVVRALLVRWYIAAAGLLLTLLAAGIAFASVPVQYISTGSAVLVRPKQVGTAMNPLLSFDPSLSTTALILINGLNAPGVPGELGLTPGKDKFTVQSATSSYAGDQIVQPFINVTAQSPTADGAARIVASVLDRARAGLQDEQKSLGVTRSNYIKFQTLVSATPPKPVLTTALVLPGAIGIAGVLATISFVLLIERISNTSLHQRRDSSGTSGPVSREPPGLRASSLPLALDKGVKNGSVAAKGEPEFR